MFGGKREKALLEEELLAVKAENERRGELLLEFSKQKDNALEQFARITASHAQMENDVEQIKDQMQHICELAENSSQTAGDIHNAMIEMKHGVETFDANHSVFVEQVRKQNEKVVDIVESNKHFTTPMKHISEMPAALREEQQAFCGRADRMMELSKNMSVLSLNAAIEAGRMGESGSRFIATAEEIRSFSENYEREAREFKDALTKSEARITELEEQVHHLNELLKENNISMTKLYKDCTQNMASYEAEQTEIRGLISDTVVGRADALRQWGAESAKTQERMLLQMGDVQEELKEHKSSADELENIYKGLQQSAEKGQQD